VVQKGLPVPHAQITTSPASNFCSASILLMVLINLGISIAEKTDTLAHCCLSISAKTSALIIVAIMPA
jgi:hypothetical protein